MFVLFLSSAFLVRFVYANFFTKCDLVSMLGKDSEVRGVECWKLQATGPLGRSEAYTKCRNSGYYDVPIFDLEEGSMELWNFTTFLSKTKILPFGQYDNVTGLRQRNALWVTMGGEFEDHFLRLMKKFKDEIAEANAMNVTMECALLTIDGLFPAQCENHVHVYDYNGEEYTAKIQYHFCNADVFKLETEHLVTIGLSFFVYATIFAIGVAIMGCILSFLCCVKLSKKKKAEEYEQFEKRIEIVLKIVFMFLQIFSTICKIIGLLCGAIFDSSMTVWITLMVAIGVDMFVVLCASLFEFGTKFAIKREKFFSLNEDMDVFDAYFYYTGLIEGFVDPLVLMTSMLILYWESVSYRHGYNDVFAKWISPVVGKTFIIIDIIVSLMSFDNIVFDHFPEFVKKLYKKIYLKIRKMDEKDWKDRDTCWWDVPILIVLFIGFVVACILFGSLTFGSFSAFSKATRYPDETTVTSPIDYTINSRLYAMMYSMAIFVFSFQSGLKIGFNCCFVFNAVAFFFNVVVSWIVFFTELVPGSEAYVGLFVTLLVFPSLFVCTFQVCGGSLYLCCRASKGKPKKNKEKKNEEGNTTRTDDEESKELKEEPIVASPTVNVNQPQQQIEMSSHNNVVQQQQVQMQPAHVQQFYPVAAGQQLPQQQHYPPSPTPTQQQPLLQSQDTLKKEIGVMSS